MLTSALMTLKIGTKVKLRKVTKISKYLMTIRTNGARYSISRKDLHLDKVGRKQY